MTKKEQKQQHVEASDSAAEVLRDLVVMNKIMHDGLSEAQTMIGKRDLDIIALELENQELRDALSMERIKAKQHITPLTCVSPYKAPSEGSKP